MGAFQIRMPGESRSMEEGIKRMNKVEELKSYININKRAAEERERTKKAAKGKETDAKNQNPSRQGERKP